MHRMRRWTKAEAKAEVEAEAKAKAIAQGEDYLWWQNAADLYRIVNITYRFRDIKDPRDMGISVYHFTL